MIIDFVRAFNAYILHLDEGPKSIALYYSNFSDPTFVVKTTLYWIQTMLGDSVIVRVKFLYFDSAASLTIPEIWRCYVVYDRRYRVILFPSTLFAAAFGVYSTCKPYPQNVALKSTHLDSLMKLAFGIIILRTFTHFVRGATVYETAHKFITTFFVLTMAINIYCTCAFHFCFEVLHSSVAVSSYFLANLLYGSISSRIWEPGTRHRSHRRKWCNIYF